MCDEKEAIATERVVAKDATINIPLPLFHFNHKLPKVWAGHRFSPSISSEQAVANLSTPPLIWASRRQSEPPFPSQTHPDPLPHKSITNCVAPIPSSTRYAFFFLYFHLHAFYKQPNRDYPNGYGYLYLFVNKNSLEGSRKFISKSCLALASAKCVLKFF